MAARAKGGRTKTKSPESNKAGRKKKSPAQSAGAKEKKKKKTGVGADKKPYLLGLSLGLLIGCLGAVLVLYAPQAVKPPAAPKKEAVRQTSSDQPEPAKIIYEENRILERRIKQLDRAIYGVFRDLGLPEENVRFLRVTPATRGDREWDHTLIEVLLTKSQDLQAMIAALETALGRVDSESRPRLSVAKTGAGAAVKIFYDDIETHALRLRAGPEAGASAGPVGPEPAQDRPRLAIVIDDFGLSSAQAQCFLNLDFPVTFSILPFLPHGQEIARQAHDQGREVLLHMPMEPAHWPQVEAGPGCLLVAMDRAEIETGLDRALETLPEAAGVNNHMGSRFTEDRERMGWVLTEIGKRGLFFLDSRTSMRSQAYAEARRLGVRAAQRSIFLDNVQDPEAIRVQLRKLVAKARDSGQAVGIGHVYPVTCQVLKNEYNYLKTNVNLVRVSDLVQ